MRDYPIPLEELTLVANNEKHLSDNEFDIGASVRKIDTALANDARVTRLTYEVAKPLANAKKKPDDGKADITPYEIHIIVKFRVAG